MTVPSATALSAYHQAVALARSTGLALSGDAQSAMLVLLADWAEELAVLVEGGKAGGGQRALLAEVRGMYARLADDVDAATVAGVRLTTAQVAKIHAEATNTLMRESGRFSGNAFVGVDVRAAQAVLARGDYGKAIRSLREDSAEAAVRIIQRGRLRGAPNAAVARELRIHIGAPGSVLEGDAGLLLNRRRISYTVIEEMGYPPTPENLLLVRGEAGRLAARAQLIARTEHSNAEHEAHARTLAVSPVVAFVRVRVSYRHTGRDQCDAAAEANLYGLGPGCYPPERVPARFHPRCLCPFSHELRPMDQWGMPRPEHAPWGGTWEDLAAEHKLPPSEAQSLMAAISVGDARGEDEQQTAARRSRGIPL